MNPVQLCALAGLSDGAISMLAPRRPLRAYAEALANAGLLIDAIRSMAYLLPAAESIRWAAGIVRSMSTARPASLRAAALAAVDAWLEEPDEATRRQAWESAEQAGFEHTESCLAMAVFFSGGSIAPVDQPELPPSENLHAASVAGAVLLAGVERTPEQAPERYQAWFQDALKRADAIRLWDSFLKDPDHA